MKYWSSSHFCREILSYCTKPHFLSPDEAIMKGAMRSWFKGLGYEYGFGPGEMSSSKVRNRLTDAYAIVSMVNREERKEIFGEDEVLGFLF